MDPKTMTMQDDPAAGNGEQTDEYTAGEGKQIMLDKGDPDIADAFEGCKVGDMYKVVKDDDNTLTLESMPGEGEPAALWRS